MTTLEKLSKFIATNNTGTVWGELIVEAKAEIERLEKENTMLKSALTRIRDLCQQTCKTFEDQSFEATRIAQEALSE